MPQAKPWGGRFSAPTDALVESFTSSIEDDQNIALEDVEGSRAHARMLMEAGLITAEEHAALDEGLAKVAQELQSGTFQWSAALEDVHMNIERRLAALIGDEIAGKLHTARSRNDQVATDAHLYLRRRLTEIQGRLIELERALVAQATAHVDTLMPGYTHMQRGQPVRLAHHLLAYRHMFARDRARVGDALGRVDRCPLGAGALAGTPHPIDRARSAELLGFSRPTENSMDTVADRDTFLEAMSAASISMIHLSRLAEELVLWSSQEFGFIEIADAFTTGSSMMPQKKNPDVAELVRGRCGRVIGDLVALLVTLKALPLTYNRDLQEDKPPLYDALSTWSDCLQVTARMMPAVRFLPGPLKSALKKGFVNATELADYLVTKGAPFRAAHEVVGKLVAHCVKEGCALDDLSVQTLQSFDSRFDEDARAWLDFERAIDRRAALGGPAKARVQEALQQASAELDALGATA